MPKRSSVKRFETDEIQGEGSFVVITGLKVHEVRELRSLAEDEDYDTFEGGVDLIRKHVLDWNWVDDEGEPLPLPADDPEVVYELTNEESEYLADVMSGSPKDLKN